MTSRRKYEFTGEIVKHGDRTLRQIRRLSDGLIGGYIESEKNLSHNGDCFVYNNAWVYNNAQVRDNAQVYNNAQVYDNARVMDNAWVMGVARVYNNAQVYDNARVMDNALVYDNARVYGNARVYNNAQVYGLALVYDNAQVYGLALVYDNAQVYDNALVYHNARVYGNAQVYHNARVCGQDIVTGPTTFIRNLCQFNITASKKDDYIRVGCKSHSTMEWLSYIGSGERLYLDLFESVQSHDQCVRIIKTIIEEIKYEKVS